MDMNDCFLRQNLLTQWLIYLKKTKQFCCGGTIITDWIRFRGNVCFLTECSVAKKEVWMWMCKRLTVRADTRVIDCYRWDINGLICG